MRSNKENCLPYRECWQDMAATMSQFSQLRWSMPEERVSVNGIGTVSSPLPLSKGSLLAV